jgi:hypothetical protein
VLDAYETADCDPYKVDPRQAGLAAALRAAADQVMPDEPDYMRVAVPSTDWWDKHDQIRSELFAIATELEAH